MTADERIERLENRVDRHEDRYHADITAIHAKLDAMTALISQALVDSAKTACPSPGACVTLSVTQSALVKKTENLDERMTKLEKWQGQMLGAFACIAFLLTVFGPTIRKFLNLA